MMKGLAVLALLLSGCDLYFGGGDDIGDPPCLGTGGDIRDNGQRDPATGQCYWDYGCTDSCGCYDDGGGEGKLPPEADWGACYSQCSELDAPSCGLTAGCFAAYIDNPAADGRQFWGCWQTAPSGPVQGQCTNLDAYGCSRHDDCIAVYASNYDNSATTFEACEPELYPEPQACDAITCAAGYHCEQQCYGTDPMMQSCEAVCVSDSTCANVDCGAGYSCAEVCTTDANGQVSCYPSCVLDPTVPACETLTTEMSCIGRMDCVPVYDGQDCTCYPDHCECQVLTYERCESL